MWLTVSNAPPEPRKIATVVLGKFVPVPHKKHDLALGKIRTFHLLFLATIVTCDQSSSVALSPRSWLDQSVGCDFC